MLVALERGYAAEALVGALRGLRPGLRVSYAEPREVGREVLRLRPDVVVYGEPSEVVETRCGAWILLYPGGERRVVVGVGGERAEYSDLGLDGILAVIDGVDTSTRPA